MDKEYISVTDTAKILRKALKSKFPGIKFSVRSSSYAGGASIHVRWIDGPSSTSVEEVTKQYEGADFDGMIDLKTYKTHFDKYGNAVHYGADFIFAKRSYSEAFTRKIADSIAHKRGLGYCLSEWGKPEWLDVRTEAGVETSPVDHARRLVLDGEFHQVSQSTSA